MCIDRRKLILRSPFPTLCPVFEITRVSGGTKRRVKSTRKEKWKFLKFNHFAKWESNPLHTTLRRHQFLTFTYKITYFCCTIQTLGPLKANTGTATVTINTAHIVFEVHWLGTGIVNQLHPSRF